MLDQETIEKISNLDDLEKIQLIEWLMDNLDQPDPQVEKEWIKESEKRYQAFKKGQVKKISLEEINLKFKS
ncbi:addiction module protein [candidate division KSB1 bacterium]|nr:addiction module protein [candidate division KSB1 bacterium]